MRVSVIKMPVFGKIRNYAITFKTKTAQSEISDWADILSPR